MRIGVWIPQRQLTSVQIYATQVMDHLRKHGVEIFPFGPKDTVPENMDLYWDPWCTDGKNPNRRLLGVKAPIVATVHGMASGVLPKALQPKFYKKWGFLQKPWKLFQRRFFWNLFRRKVAAVITVSAYAKTEIEQYLSIPPEKIYPVYHGVDKAIFHPVLSKPEPYFFHISAWQPKKNVRRIVEAYAAIQGKKWPLKIVSPGCREELPKVPGLELRTSGLPSVEVAKLMQEAGVFVFPSLHESFGMPLAEAMASGVPVITSNNTACAEISGDAAIHVDSYNVQSIAKALEQLMQSEALRHELEQKAIERSALFSWEKCGKEHLEIFQKITADSGPRTAD